MEGHSKYSWQVFPWWLPASCLLFCKPQTSLTTVGQSFLSLTWDQRKCYQSMCKFKRTVCSSSRSKSSATIQARDDQRGRHSNLIALNELGVRCKHHSYLAMEHESRARSFYISAVSWQDVGVMSYSTCSWVRTRSSSNSQQIGHAVFPKLHHLSFIFMLRP